VGENRRANRTARPLRHREHLQPRHVERDGSGLRAATRRLIPLKQRDDLRLLGGSSGTISETQSQSPDCQHVSEQDVHENSEKGDQGNAAPDEQPVIPGRFPPRHRVGVYGSTLFLTRRAERLALWPASWASASDAEIRGHDRDRPAAERAWCGLEVLGRDPEVTPLAVEDVLPVRRALHPLADGARGARLW
jgi:hypothetical protein